MAVSNTPTAVTPSTFSGQQAGTVTSGVGNANDGTVRPHVYQENPASGLPIGPDTQVTGTLTAAQIAPNPVTSTAGATVVLPLYGSQLAVSFDIRGTFTTSTLMFEQLIDPTGSVASSQSWLGLQVESVGTGLNISGPANPITGFTGSGSPGAYTGHAAPGARAIRIRCQTLTVGDSIAITLSASSAEHAKSTVAGLMTVVDTTGSTMPVGWTSGSRPVPSQINDGSSLTLGQMADVASPWYGVAQTASEMQVLAGGLAPWQGTKTTGFSTPTLLKAGPIRWGGMAMYNPNATSAFVQFIDPTVTGTMPGADALATPGAQTGLTLTCATSLSLAAGTSYLLLDQGNQLEVVAITAISGSSPSWTGVGFTTTLAHPSLNASVAAKTSFGTIGQQTGVVVTLTAGTPGVLSVGDSLVLDTSTSQETVVLQTVAEFSASIYVCSFVTTKTHATTGTVSATTVFPVYAFTLGVTPSTMLVTGALGMTTYSTADVGRLFSVALIAAATTTVSGSTAVTTGIHADIFWK